MKTNGPRSYKDLIVWQKAIEFAKLIYQLTKTFPVAEKFGIVAQMRRAGVSIPSNMAKGQARHTTGEFIQFISHAEGSVAELDTQLILSLELKFCNSVAAEPAFAVMSEIRRMLNALRRKLAARD
jgi:four helix bundle protein